MILAPNGQHLRVQHTYGTERRLLLLDPARGKERLMEIQQHDGVVVDVADLGRASPSFCERERCCRGRGRRQGLWCCCPPSPTIYRPPGGGASPWEIKSPREGGGQVGGKGCLAPQGKGEGEVDGDPAARRRGGGCSGDLGRASPSFCERERCCRGTGRRQDLGCGCPPSPSFI